MGWSYTCKAGRTLDAIEEACSLSRRPHKVAVSNAFFANGKRYHYEVSRRDMPDGGIAGAVFLSLSETTCRQVGRFRIDGRGYVVRGPKLFRDAPPTAEGLEIDGEHIGTCGDGSKLVRLRGFVYRLRYHEVRGADNADGCPVWVRTACTITRE
jgi:hypothetical protein